MEEKLQLHRNVPFLLKKHLVITASHILTNLITWSESCAVVPKCRENFFVPLGSIDYDGIQSP